MNDIVPHESIVNFEREIGGLLKGTRTYPAPVEPQDIGRLSAEAVMKQWQQTAADIESMASEVKERAAKLEAALQDCDQDLKLLAGAAQAIRTKGTAIHAMIEQANETSKNIRDIVADFNNKVT